MRKLNFFIVQQVIGIGFLLTSCNGSHTNNESKSVKDTLKPLPPIILAKVSASPDFPDASLSLKSVKSEKSGADSAKIMFEFDVKNYELKAQTADKDTKMCNNSDKGQHIHLILDNKPYTALYEPTNTVTLANGTEHRLVAFLSRSYHESIKNPKAAVDYHFKIDDKGNMKMIDDDPKIPMLIYSRPKGDYFGKDTDNILLDFYVLNCTIAHDSFYVRADIMNLGDTGRHISLNITKWESNFIQNLGTGKCRVTLSLIDNDNIPLDGDTIIRDFTLSASEPIKN